VVFILGGKEKKGGRIPVGWTREKKEPVSCPLSSLSFASVKEKKKRRWLSVEGEEKKKKKKTHHHHHALRGKKGGKEEVVAHLLWKRRKEEKRKRFSRLQLSSYPPNRKGENREGSGEKKKKGKRILRQHLLLPLPKE